MLTIMSSMTRRVICLFVMYHYIYMLFFFFFNDTATTEIYTLSLHDALPISPVGRRADQPAISAPPSALEDGPRDRKSTRLNSSHTVISYAVFCLKKKKKKSTHSDTIPLRHPSK